MPYKIIWSARAEMELAKLTLNAIQAQSLSDAMSRVESALAGNPRTIGDMLLVSTRILVDIPLGVVFDIIEDDKVVLISDAWFVK